MLHWSNGEDSILTRSSDQFRLKIEYLLPKTNLVAITKIPVPKRQIQNQDIFSKQGCFEFTITQQIKKRFLIEIRTSLNFIEAKFNYKINKFSLQLFRSSGFSDVQIINYNYQSQNFGIGISY